MHRSDFCERKPQLLKSLSRYCPIFCPFFLRAQVHELWKLGPQPAAHIPVASDNQWPPDVEICVADSSVSQSLGAPTSPKDHGGRGPATRLAPSKEGGEADGITMDRQLRGDVGIPSGECCLPVGL